MKWLRRLLSPSEQDELSERAARIAILPDEVVAAESRLLAPILSSIMYDVGSRLAPHTTTMDIAAALDRSVRQQGLYPAMLGFNGFPAAAAVSINEQIVHGVPSSRRLADGDLVTVELSVASDKGYASQGWTFPVGQQCSDATTLLNVGPKVLRTACSTAVGRATSAR
jgi:methionyl aminopeptidase